MEGDSSTEGKENRDLKKEGNPLPIDKLFSRSKSVNKKEEQWHWYYNKVNWIIEYIKRLPKVRVNI